MSFKYITSIRYKLTIKQQKNGRFRSYSTEEFKKLPDGLIDKLELPREDTTREKLEEIIKSFNQTKLINKLVEYYEELDQM